MPRSMRKLSLPLAAALGAAAAVLGVVGLANGGEAAAVPRADHAVRASSAASQIAALQNAYVSVVQKVRPSVVQIETDSGLGSGIVYDRQGHIVTNAHVVGDAQTMTVTLANSKRYQARLVGSFPANDLAVIDIDAPGLRPASFANSDRTRVGNIVMAVGNPLGFTSSVTEGIISAKGRVVSEPNGATIPGAIQTSAPINPGNSGGALVDLSGRVVGIPTLAANSGTGAAAGIGFAIASDTVRNIAGQLIRSGRVTNSGRAYLGIRTGDVLGGGAYVGDVEAGTPAARAGMRAGDVIVSIGGKTVASAENLGEVLAAFKPGQQVKVVVRRADSSRATLDVTLGEYPSS